MLALSCCLVGTSVFLKLHVIENPLPPDISLMSIKKILIHAIFGYYVWLMGLSCFLGLLIWVYVVNSYSLSQAYPLASFCYVLMVIAGKLLFDEPITIAKLTGVLLICAGVAIIGAET